MEYLLITPNGSYRIPLDTEESGTLIDLLDFYASKGVCEGPGQVRALGRQQVLARLGRPTLPEDKDHPFPVPAVIVGDETAGSFTRGWLDWQITAYQDAKARAKTAPVDIGDSVAAVATGESETVQAGVEDIPEQGVDSGHDSGERTPSVQAEDVAHNEQHADVAAEPPKWVRGTRQWEANGSADDRVVLVTSHGIAAPSGWVLTGPVPSPASIPKFVAYHWRKKPNDLPQLWFTAEAMDRLGMPVEDADEQEVATIVSDTFDCRVSYHKSGFFTCRWGTSTDEGGAAASTSNRSAQLVFIPWLPLDPSPARPGDLGVAGIEGKPTELPDDEDQAVPILAERIAWLCKFGPGVLPAPRWSTPGAAFADVKRRQSSVTKITAGPFPSEVLAAQVDVDPDMHTAKRPHKSRSEYIIVETDQRAAYLASAGMLQLGYGEPTRVANPQNVDVLTSQQPPFGVWHVTTPAGKDIDGLDKRLPLPNGYMDWDEPRSFWSVTRGVQHILSSVETGGTGLTPAELQIDAAWLWPHQHQLLRQWAAAIREEINAAIREGRQDRVDMLQAMYKAYLGRGRSDKWSPRQAHHHQPVHYASLQADTRWRAQRFAVRVKNAYGFYPVMADVDSWTYWLPTHIECADCAAAGCERCDMQGRTATDPKTILEEPSQANGKYRIKKTEYPSGDGGEQG